MIEREALLRAICENPDDDTPRLVFADWLDESGEPERAEFIRVQIRTESAARHSREWVRLTDHARQLSEKACWSPKPGPCECGQWEDYRRGFVDGLWVERLEPFLAQPAAYFEQAPIRELAVGGRVSIPRLLAIPYLQRIRVLRIWDREMTDGELRLLAERSLLDRLTEIHIFVAGGRRLRRSTEDLLYERFHDRLNLIDEWEDDH
jgi:uncharacterized protein (TIGR02996 family)